MNRHFLFNRFLPSFIGLLLGVAASGATLSYYRGNPFDVVLIGAVLYVIGFVIASLLIAAVVWAVGWVTVGALGREQFQSIWVVIAALIQFLIAALSTYDLSQLGVLSGFFSKPDIYPRLMVLALPYVATLQSLATLLNDETEADRRERLVTLNAVESQFSYEKSKSRAAATVPIAICVVVGGVVGWVFPLEPGAALLTSALGASVGLPLGMAIYRYLPGQRRLRELEKAKEHLRW